MRKRNLGGQFESVYPFNELDIEDYFLVKTDKENKKFPKKYANIRSAAYMYGKRNSAKFTCCQVPEGVKVQRIQ